MRYTYQRETIASGASTTDEIDLRDFRLVAIQMPPDWTAANLSFDAAGRPDQAEDTDPQFDHVYDSSGAEVAVTAAADRYVVFTSAHVDALDALTRVKIRSGIAAGFVNQGADRVLTLVLEPR